MNIINDLVGMVYINGMYVIRPTADKRTMIIGVSDATPFINKEPDDEVWVGDMMMSFPRRFKLPEEYAGMRADQILCSNLRASNLEEIK